MKLFGIIGLALLVFAASAQADSFAVDRTDDASVGACTAAANDCTLRGAILTANAGGVDSAITLPAGRIVLTGALPEIRVSLTMQGAGARASLVDGSAATDFTGASALVTGDASLTLRDVQVTGTPDDPAIGRIAVLARGNASLERVAIVGNHATGFLNSEIGSLVDSVVARNTGENVGGIQNTNELLIRNSTIAENVAVPPTLNPPFVISGGVEGGFLVIEHSTIAHNGVGGGGVAILGANVGGFPALQPAVSIESSIIAGGGRFGDCGGSKVRSLGHNLDSDGSCKLSAPGDQSRVDPKLGPLANNGGPTDTMALLQGSPAIDAGSGCDVVAGDQRGSARVQGTTCDSGAFESPFTAPIAVTTPPVTTTAPPVMTPPGNTGLPPDRMAPRLTIGGVGKVVSRGAFNAGLKIRIASNEPIVAELTLLNASHHQTLATRAVLAGIGAARAVTLRPIPKLHARATLKGQLRVIASDAAGNRSTKTVAFTVK